MTPAWKKYIRYTRDVVGWGALAFITIQLLLAGYPVVWTGFGEYTLPNGDFVPAKKLWDWMELLIIPTVLAGGAFFLNRAERNTEREIATDRQQEAALQSYIDRMAELLLEENLRRSDNSAEVRNVARTRTLTVLRVLDANRKGQVINFLYEANLIINPEPIVILAGADLTRANLHGILHRVDLSGANLRNADIRRAVLNEASLQSAILEGANLNRTDLIGANLQYADLEHSNMLRANLRKANLVHARLSGADLRGTFFQGADLSVADLSRTNLFLAELEGADLSNSNLSKAKVTKEQLAKAKSLQQAIMPDGTLREYKKP